MSVCRYYLHGTCRYGDRCRMQHVPNQTVQTSRFHAPCPSIDPRYNYRASDNVKTNHTVENSIVSRNEISCDSQLLKWITDNFKNKEKALNIIHELKTEAKFWQKSEHLWRFTSKSLFPGGRPLEGWTDHSFEEIKWAHRSMISANQEHLYTKTYYDHLTNVNRQLAGLVQDRIETFQLLKDYINEYIASNHQPTRTLATDIEMKDVSDNATSNILPQIQTTNYTPDDQLPENERAAFESETFEFGKIPVHAPSKQFC